MRPDLRNIGNPTADTMESNGGCGNPTGFPQRSERVRKRHSIVPTGSATVQRAHIFVLANTGIRAGHHRYSCWSTQNWYSRDWYWYSRDHVATVLGDVGTKLNASWSLGTPVGFPHFLLGFYILPVGFPVPRNFYAAGPTFYAGRTNLTCGRANFLCDRANLLCGRANFVRRAGPRCACAAPAPPQCRSAVARTSLAAERQRRRAARRQRPSQCFLSSHQWTGPDSGLTVTAASIDKHAAYRVNARDRLQALSPGGLPRCTCATTLPRRQSASLPAGGDTRAAPVARRIRDLEKVMYLHWTVLPWTILPWTIPSWTTGGNTKSCHLNGPRRLAISSMCAIPRVPAAPRPRIR